MNTEFDDVERKLRKLRPARLPVEIGQQISREIQRPLRGQGVVSWLFGHRAGFPVALAGALSIAVVAGLHWLPQSLPPASFDDQPRLVASNSFSSPLAFLEARIGVASSISINSVDVLRSPSILTNTQIRR